MRVEIELWSTPRVRAALGLVCLWLFGANLVSAAEAVDEPWTTDEVELITGELSPWLDELGRWIRSAGEAPPVGSKRPWTIPAGTGEALALGPVSVARTGASGADAVDVDGAIFRVAITGGPLAGDPEVGETFAKVIGIERTGPAPSGGSLARADVRFEVRSAEGPTALSQRTAILRVDFVTELRVEGQPLALDEVQSVALLHAEGARSKGPLLVDRTAQVFSSAPRAAELLGVGLDRWAQALDDGAWTAWFGHQGLAVGDANGDGMEDLYVAMPSGLPNLLLVSQEDGTVMDVGEETGTAWLDDTKGVLMVDMDGDGRDEIVSALGHVIVVQSRDENGIFQVTGAAAGSDEVPFYGITASDVDGDGDMDLYGARYVTRRYGEAAPMPFHEARNGPRNELFLQGPRGFRPAAEALGLGDEGGGRFSLAAHFVDFDADGDRDLYVVNDFGSNQLFELRRGPGGPRFKERATELGAADPGAGMGATFADVDLDGDLDLYVTNMYSSAGRRVAFQETFASGRSSLERAGIQRLSLGNSLLLQGEGAFAPAPGKWSSARMGRWGFGAVFADLNGDALPDLVAPAGFLTGPEPGDL